jgi:hypothetical protein
MGGMLFATVVGGIGFGTVFSGTLRSLPYAQPGERVGLLSAYLGPSQGEATGLIEGIERPGAPPSFQSCSA